MRIFDSVAAVSLLLLAACGDGADDRSEHREGSAGSIASGDGASTSGETSNTESQPSNPEAPGGSGNWDISAGEAGITLALGSRSGGARLRFFCPSGRDELHLQVADFSPVGSEERMTFGSNGTVHTLVANPGASGRGVRASGRVPDDLQALIEGPVSVNYGSQDSGPHAGPPAAFARRFESACRAEIAAQDVDQQVAGEDSVSACLIQDGDRLRNPPLRALGTEPFWAARTNGRCVTYSHPEDQDGTRIWTTYEPGPDGSGTWSGALGDHLFELTISARPRCSDGMSDKAYPFEAELKVHGEIRRGCAEPVQPDG